MKRRLFRFILALTLSAIVCITAPIAVASVSSSALEQQARSHYTHHQFSEAATLFQQAAQSYKAAGDPIRQGLSLSNLSLSYQQLGKWEPAQQAIADSLSILQATPETTSGRSIAIAQALDIQGSLLLARGQTNAALTSWKQATEIYQKEGKPDRALAGQINQAQALQNMGLYRRAIAQLDQALSLRSREHPEALTTSLERLPATAETVTALTTLGESLRVVGDFSQAKQVLNRGLAIATQLRQPDAIALVQLTLGNTLRAEGFSNPEANNHQAALNYYKQAALGSGNLRIQARLNQLSLLAGDQRKPEADQLITQLQPEIAALPPSRSAIESRINLAHTMMQISQNPRSVAESLAIAVQQSKALGDLRTQSYAVGSLGSVYEETQQWQDAEKLTNQALQLAQQIQAGDIAYRWQWQLGRILNAKGDRLSAIGAYQQAVNTIKSLRQDLAASSPDVQFSFRTAIEPIHRQLVSLLLNSNQPDRLKTARKVIEDLQVVELDNFFREACLNVNPAQVDRVDQDAAIIYPILLDDQLSVIVSLPKDSASDNLRYHTVKVSRKEVEQLAVDLRNGLDQGNTLRKLTLPMLQQMYGWLIRPFEAEFADRKPKTLVFVLDGALRNLPMSALHDGNQFLIEKYSVAVAPGLQLVSARPLSDQRLGALVAGLTEARAEFPPLPGVKSEVQKIEQEIPSKVLFDRNFTTSAFEDNVSQASFPIVHLATHGRFSSRKEDTFILTWDGSLRVADLSSVLQTVELSRALELLVLSACETAEGDPQSALGLAGIAVQSGARSTVATLWRVNDEASARLMEVFYSELSKISKTGMSKAEALRSAQLAILNDPIYEQEPFYWAAYILLGNWT